MLHHLVIFGLLVLAIGLTKVADLLMTQMEKASDAEYDRFLYAVYGVLGVAGLSFAAAFIIACVNLAQYIFATL